MVCLEPCRRGSILIMAGMVELALPGVTLAFSLAGRGLATAEAEHRHPGGCLGEITMVGNIDYK